MSKKLFIILALIILVALAVFMWSNNKGNENTVPEETATNDELIDRLDDNRTAPTDRIFDSKTGRYINVPSRTKNPSIISDSYDVMELSYAHVAPGEYTEVYAVVKGAKPGELVTAHLNRLPTLTATGTGGKTETLMVVADENGVAHFTWEITQYGEYKVETDLYDGDDGRPRKAESTIMVK